ncbi:MAG: AtpZ/AtpI family protein [Candidatus Eremiobacterales bacterium]
MKQQTPLSLGELAGAGTGIVGSIAVGLILGYLAARYLHWNWALPVGIVMGFVAGVVSMYQRLSKLA